MNQINEIKELQARLKSLKTDGKSIGFVPTMGALHEGHLKLVEECKLANDICVVSIFVNPLQFDNADDLEKYPRDLVSDAAMLEKVGVDVLFAPTVSEMYPKPAVVNILFGEMATLLEGKYRNGHFEGVGVVVSKLLHIVSPDKAYFGLKDLQQYMLIKRMCDDLSFPLEIIGVDIVREESGLARSSRNRRLSKEGLEIASNISKGLGIAKEMLDKKSPISEIKQKLTNFYNGVEGLDTEYVEVVDGEDLTSLDDYPKSESIAICVAAYVENVRLIDNLFSQDLKN